MKYIATWETETGTRGAFEDNNLRDAIRHVKQIARDNASLTQLATWSVCDANTNEKIAGGVTR